MLAVVGRVSIAVSGLCGANAGQVNRAESALTPGYAVAVRVPGGRLRPFPWRETAYLASGLVVGLPMLIMFGLALLLSALVVVLPAAALDGRS